MIRRTLVTAGILACLTGLSAFSDGPIRIVRVSGEVVIDGKLDEPLWNEAVKVEGWFETNPGDNLEPKVKNVGYLAYDDKYLFVAFEFFDPDPESIVAPYADRDNVPSSTDYGGIILDTNNDRRSAVMLLANPRGIQYDALSNDASGEDSAPDFFWDSAGRILEDRWVLELRIPFTSLRYNADTVQQWGMMMYRNWPRDRRYQMFSSRLPRDVSCFICSRDQLEGLRDLPSSGGLVLAPYATADQSREPSGELGTPLESGDAGLDAGLDLKWTPNANTAIDGTVNPDFSQIEADVAVISTNERFAISLPEKRPFFLESKDLFATPFAAVYTRSINDPQWGARASGAVGDLSYTALLADDRGDGLVILSGPTESGFARTDFGSLDFVGRGRYDLGQSFVSLLATAKEIDGGGYNRVIGPDFEWRINDQDRVTGQIILSESETPNRPDLAEEWNGQKLSGHAGTAWWSHGGEEWDWLVQYLDVGDDFRADLGFIPQVGVREGFGEVGRTFRPKGFLSRVRVFFFGDYTGGRNGDLIFRGMSPGVGMDGRWNSFMRFRIANDKVRARDKTLERTQFFYTVQASPSRFFNRVSLDGWIGEEIDFANARVGDGARVSLDATLRPSDHLELVLDTEYRYLDVDGGRLFAAEVGRLKATYTFSAKSFVRVIGQHVRTDRDPSLYDFPIAAQSGANSISGLFAYKLNWQTVFFLGFGDADALTDDGTFEDSGQSVFLKISYAWQL